MLRYLLRRVLFAILLIVVVSSCALILAHLAPGDFASQLVGTGATPETIARERARLGLDRPLHEQYIGWLVRLAHLDLGVSLAYARPVGDLLGERAGNTAVLATAALALATLVGLPLGVLTGSTRNAVVHAVRWLSLVCVSLPPFLTSMVFALIAARTGLFPIGGMMSPVLADAGWVARAGDLAWHLTLPAVALALPVAATLERVQGVALAETLAEPFVLSALARGVSRRRIVWRHGLRLAIRAPLSIYGIIIGGLFSGSFAVEIVTSWPGLGRLMYDALLSRDPYLAAGCAAAGTVFLACGTLIADLALAAADPRLRESS